MNFSVITYSFYLALSIAMTVWVAHSLRKNGRYFLVDVFRGDQAMADSVNQLLVVGFYLINLGYISFMLKLGYELPTLTVAIEALSGKVGMVLIVLGVMHFFNLFIFSRIRRRHSQGNHVPQVLPAVWASAELPNAAPQTSLYRYQGVADEN
jgi:hypothetical protein